MSAARRVPLETPGACDPAGPPQSARSPVGSFTEPARGIQAVCR